MARLPRVYAVVDQETLDLLDDDAKKRKVNRSQWVLQAIKEYLHAKGDVLQQQLDDTTAELSHLNKVLDDNNKELVDLKNSHVVVDAEVTRLREELDRAKSEAAHQDTDLAQEVTTLKTQLDEATTDAQVKEGELTQLKKDAELKWRETSQLRSEVSQARRELEGTRSKRDQLQNELDKKREEADQARHETESLKLAQVHFQDTIKLRDQHISFLEGHLSQLTEKIQARLPPSQEEAKKKGWWQFWR